MSGWSNTSYRGGNSGGYVPGSDSNISDGLSGTSTRGGGFDNVDTYNNPYVHNTGEVGVPSSGPFIDTYNNPYVHNTGEVGIPTEATFDTHHHHSSSSGLGSVARNIYDSLNSKFGKNHTGSGLSGTSTRGGAFDSYDNSGSGTSFR